MKKLILSLFVIFMTQFSKAQVRFADKCVGVWKGTMYIYNRGVLKDSVSVQLTVEQTQEPNVWTWRTAYLSAKMPMVKDYKLRLKDANKNTYITDEGGGVELLNYAFGDKLYNVFETHDVMLTSSYELVGKTLIFEITSGKKDPTSIQGVTNFSVDNLQRVVFRK
jgi:hypothetical protein